MIKKSWLVTGFATITLLAGCQLNGEQPTNLQKTANRDDQMANQSQYQITQAHHLNEYAHYGYSRFQKQQVQSTAQNLPAIDRKQLSNGITRLVLTNPTVNEAATLVTDKYVLVTYDADTDNRELVADQVKRSAISITPRYLDVYISDDHELFDDIERFQGLTSTNPAYEHTLEQTIEEMKQSPQGQYDERSDHDPKTMEKKHKDIAQTR